MSHLVRANVFLRFLFDLLLDVTNTKYWLVVGQAVVDHRPDRHTLGPLRDGFLLSLVYVVRVVVDGRRQLRDEHLGHLEHPGDDLSWPVLSVVDPVELIDLIKAELSQRPLGVPPASGWLRAEEQLF